MKDKVSQVLQQILEENNFSYRELARALNIPYTTVVHWFTNNNTPRLNYIKRIAETFGINILRFF